MALIYFGVGELFKISGVKIGILGVGGLVLIWMGADMLRKFRRVGVTEPDIYYYIFHSRSLPPDGANRGGYANPGLDRLLEQGRRETDSEKRREVYARVQEIVAGDLPYISLWHNEEVAVLSREIRGFQVYPGGDLISLQQVRIGSSP